jgi:hypothetical protein
MPKLTRILCNVYCVNKKHENLKGHYADYHMNL